MKSEVRCQTSDFIVFYYVCKASISVAGKTDSYRMRRLMLNKEQKDEESATGGRDDAMCTAAGGKN
jgi:hypothetical protein